jgi:hypothetical protein
MNLAELIDRFDETVAAVKKRIRQAGQDPDAVVDVRRAEFTLGAMTLDQDPPLFYRADLRLALQTATTVDELADTFIDKWRTQRRIDESIEPIPEARGRPRPRESPPEPFGRA